MIDLPSQADPVDQEIAEQLAHSRQTLDRVEQVLRDADLVGSLSRADFAAIDDYMQAEDERTGR